MIPALAKFLHDFFFSEERFTLWFRSTATLVALALAQIVAVPYEQVIAWHFKDWALRLGIAMIAAIAVGKAAGQKNLTDAKTTAAVDRDLATVGERKVVEPGPVIPASANPLSNPPAAPPAAGFARLSLLLLLVALALLAACATTPCVCRPADPPARPEPEALARRSPQREAAMAALRAELDQIIAANAERRARLYGGETP